MHGRDARATKERRNHSHLKSVQDDIIREIHKHMTAFWRFFLIGLGILTAWVIVPGPAWLPGQARAEWPATEPEAVGLDSQVLAEYDQAFQNGQYGPLDSFLVARHGRLVYEAYYRGHGPDVLHPVYSVTKSVTSALVGIARGDGDIGSLDQPLIPLFPEYAPVSNLDARKQAITLEHVLTMRAGFDWNEFYYPYTDSRNPFRQLMASPDWLEFMLDRRMSFWPGTVFAYNSGCTVLLAGVLLHATGRQAHEFGRERLFDPLGIDSYQWDLGPGGLTNTGGGLWLRPRDMARFGQLFLQRGRWYGRQLVPEWWVESSTARQVDFDDTSGYGYQWWLLPLGEGAAPGTGPDIWTAWGWGGQHVFVVPALDLVVVSTAGDFAEQYDGVVSIIQRLLAEIIKAPDGDVTGDGHTDAVDLAILAGMLADNLAEALPPCRWPSMGDLDANGRLDLRDLLRLQLRLTGLP